MRIFFAALIFCVAAGAVHSAEPRVTGTFSSLRFGTEDLTGVEVSLVVGGNGYYVVVQCAEGAAGVPEVAVAHIKGSQLSFQLVADTHSDCPTTEFRGTITDKGLNGKFDGSDWPGFLKRGRSYWQ